MMMLHDLSKYDGSAGFLKLLAADIQAGRNLGPLPEKLAESMLRRATGADIRLDDDFEGDVAL